ncbi:unnamed protein product [Pleuronectes platessa]|uniref:Uncharacterized protein n=1 Tax=Pleuronectes platessa TaxID=8262 RepID=A0A9N7TXA8_PLEPL|nr:unnamed protein product [Pleuronectes platessa]
MRVNIPKDNPNMTVQAVPLQSQSMVSNQQDHDPPSRPDATPVLSHRPPPPTRTLDPGPPPVPNANATQGPPPAPRSAHMTQNPPHWIHHRDPRNPWCGHRGPGSAGDKAKGFRGRGIWMEKRKEKRKEKLEREAPCVMCHKIEQVTCLYKLHSCSQSAPDYRLSSVSCHSQRSSLACLPARPPARLEKLTQLIDYHFF